MLLENLLPHLYFGKAKKPLAHCQSSKYDDGQESGLGILNPVTSEKEVPLSILTGLHPRISTRGTHNPPGPFQIRVGDPPGE